MSMNHEYKIGELATKASVNVETIRFYERKGLITQPQNFGVRLYNQDHLRRIQFIKKAQECGFTLKESAELMNLGGRVEARCSDLGKRVEDKIMQIQQKIADLQTMKKSLEGMMNSCSGPDASLFECNLYRCFEEKYQ